MRVTKTSTSVWHTTDDLWCEKCRKRQKSILQISKVGNYCRRCFSVKLAAVFISKEVVYVRVLEDIEFEIKKTTKVRERSKITNAVRYYILTRDGFKCRTCGAKAGEVQLVVDHIHPISKGGKSTSDNLQALCFTCNSGKSDG